MNKKYLLFLIVISQVWTLSAQSGKQKKADRLYEDFAYAKAVDVYRELIENEYNAQYNKQKLADTYSKLRDPENAVVYYAQVVEQPNIDPEYYFKYAQALRGVRKYEESREWLKKYRETGKNAERVENFLGKDEIRVYDGLETFSVQPADFNSELSDFGAYKSHGTIYFTSARDLDPGKAKIYAWNGEPFLDIYEVKDGQAGAATVEGNLNTKRHEGPLVITPDGKTMYFTRNNYINNHNGERDEEGTNHLKIYKATLVEGIWTNIEELPFSNNTYSVGHPALSADGKILYFASEAPGGLGGSDIYKVSIENNSYGTPENLGEPINSPGNEVFPFIKENKLYFSSDGHKGYGLLDVFVANIEDPSGVQNLGKPINSNMDDFAFTISPDHATGFVSTNREGGTGSDDIYTVEIIAPLVLKGTVTDSINSKPIANATVRLLDENNNQIAFLQTDSLGHYEVKIKRGEIYPIEAKHIEYIPKMGSINTTDLTEEAELVYNIELSPVRDVEYLAEINKIYFDFDKWNIRPDAAKELDKLVDLMKNEYPNLVIEIGSHTDRRGSVEYNRKLAERRAQSTYDYLISKGIDKNRIQTYTGYGEKKPQVDCDKCSEKEHQLNRRSVFRVVKME